MQRQTRSHYENRIAKATGATDELLPILEKIMREDVFHSTLDWQSSSEFRRGAREALALFNEHPGFFRAEMARSVSRFRVRTTEQALSNLASQSAPPESIAQAKAAYENALIEEQAATETFERELATL